MSVQTEVRDHFQSPSVGGLMHFQALWRGYRVRRNFLSHNLFQAAKKTLDQCSDITIFPRASSGITRVYFPPHLPIVFKALGIQRGKKRFFTMWQARDLCKTNGYGHLLIPSAHPYKDYNIEIRLPVDDVKQREQVALYEENQLNFSQAVKEFTGLLCQSIFPDILTDFHPYQEEEKIPLGRCDNLPLLLDKSLGKIALIDLGGFQIRREELSLEQALESFKTAIFIFPYHFEDVFETVASYCPGILDERTALQLYNNVISFRFRKIYMEHRQFVEQEIRSGGFPKHALAFSKERMEEIMQRVQRAVNEDIHLLLDKDKLLLLINQIISSISCKLADIAESISEKSSLSSYVCSRYLTLKFNDFFTVFKSEYSVDTMHRLLKIVLDELSRKEICYANHYVNRIQESLIRIHF